MSLKVSSSGTGAPLTTKGQPMPEKEKPSCDRGLIKNGYDESIISQLKLKRNIPAAVIKRLEHELHGIKFGGISLIISVRDGRPTFRIEKTISIMTTEARYE